jgi:DNA topoisomerase-3
MGKALKRVYKGEITVEDSVKIAEGEIASIFSNPKNGGDLAGVDTGKFGEIIGKCPLCGKNVVRGKSSYGCMGYAEGCKFRIGVTICRRDIPKTEVARLLETGSTARMRGFISKTGKPFDAKFVLKDGEAQFNFDK